VRACTRNYRGFAAVNTIKLMLVAAIVALAQGCTTIPRALEADAGNVQRIVWTKSTDASAFRDQNGVCHTFARDTKIALQRLGDQVRACFDRTLPQKPVSASDEKSVKVVWNKVPRAQMAGVYAEATGRGAFKGKGGGWKSADRLFAVRGFFIYNGDTCHVVVADQAEYTGTLGHEFKHCVDGYFHDNVGEWDDGEHTLRSASP
jgi:hypothetical protein